MPDRITTHDAAIEEMLRWAHGERSHWNAIAEGAGAEGAIGPGAQWASCVLADAAEVQRTIYKWPLEITDRQTLRIPGYAKFLDVQVQDGVPCLWALVESREQERERVIQIFGTGHPADEAGTYVATFQTGPLVFHVFEL